MILKSPTKKWPKFEKKNGVKKKKKSSIKKLIKSDQNCDELGNIYDHMRDFFKFESSNVKENGKIENEFSCLSCLGSVPEVNTILKTTDSNPTPQSLILHLKKVHPKIMSKFYEATNQKGNGNDCGFQKKDHLFVPN